MNDEMMKKCEEALRLRLFNLELLASAFIKETNLDPRECEMVEQTKSENGRHFLTWHFRIRDVNLRDRLLAAAPELLDECRRMHDRLARQIEAQWPMLTEIEHDDYVRLAKAISKAEGKSS